MIGGGANIINTPANMIAAVTGSYPANSNTWQVVGTVVVKGPNGNPSTVIPYVVCAH
jgi:hypothetical protein